MTTDWVCVECGAPGYIGLKSGVLCKAHADERDAKQKAEFKRLTGEAGGPWPQTCLRRMRGLGPWQRAENLDTWDVREQFSDGLVARHCSFCGSLHPDDLIRLITQEGWGIDGTDKGYKFYVRDPQGRQQSKFYTAHLADEHRAALKAFYAAQGEPNA